MWGIELAKGKMGLWAFVNMLNILLKRGLFNELNVFPLEILGTAFCELFVIVQRKKLFCWLLHCMRKQAEE